MTNILLIDFIIIVAGGAMLAAAVEYVVGMILFNFNKVSLFAIYTTATLAGYAAIFCWGWYHADNIMAMIRTFGGWVLRVIA